MNIDWSKVANELIKQSEDLSPDGEKVRDIYVMKTTARMVLVALATSLVEGLSE